VLDSFQQFWYNNSYLIKRERKKMNPFKLDEYQLQLLIDESEGILIGIEEAKLFKRKTENYAAVYSVVWRDDGSYPDAESLKGQVFITYKPNGDLIAKI
jgi:hypothetical protein